MSWSSHVRYHPSWFRPTVGRLGLSLSAGLSSQVFAANDKINVACIGVPREQFGIAVPATVASHGFPGGSTEHLIRQSRS